jgi:murein DD-endopeptidase MepM/ murein hydrolase activator NlpD
LSALPTDSVPRARRRAAALFVAALLTTGMTVAFLPASASADGPEPSVDPSASPSEVVSPSPTDVPTPSPTDDPTPTPTESPTPTDEPTPTQDPTSTPTDPADSAGPGSPWPSDSYVPWIRSGFGIGSVRVLRNEPDVSIRPRFGNDDRGWKGWKPSTDWGTYSTELLDPKAEQLRKAGVAEARILRHVYRPFIVQGPATWSDSWHAPRFAGGFHLHEGQDVLCSYGAPVLAAIDGRLAFGENSLGGLAAYVVRPSGAFLYYAHLSEQRTELTGSQVHPGDVIGKCGATGDATVPHVHFSLYDAHGVAQDPMKLLVGLLHEAEHRATGERSKPDPSPQLPQGLIPEDAGRYLASDPVPPAPASVYRAGVGLDGRAGMWDVLALIGAFGIILVPAGLMRVRKIRVLVGFNDER